MNPGYANEKIEGLLEKNWLKFWLKKIGLRKENALVGKMVARCLDVEGKWVESDHLWLVHHRIILDMMMINIIAKW